MSRYLLLILLAFINACHDSTDTSDTNIEVASSILIDWVDAGDSWHLVMINPDQVPLTVQFSLNPDQDIDIEALTEWPVTVAAGESVPAYAMAREGIDFSALDLKPWTRQLRGSLSIDHTAIYALPCDCETECRVSQGAGDRSTHKGWDIHAVDFDLPTGTPVLSISDGTVIRTRGSSDSTCAENTPECNQLVNFIEVLNPDGGIVEYLHLAKNGVLVSPGDAVRRGQKIGYSGDTGYSSGPHLHLAILMVDPDLKQTTAPIRFETTMGTMIPATGDLVSSPACEPGRP